MINVSKSFIATPPGETIKEQLVHRGMTQKEFALRMDLSEKHTSHLINGKVLLTPSMAEKLEFVLGIPASFWNNLEAIYRESLEKVRIENSLEEDMELAKQYPYAEMATRGWVQKTRSPKERVKELRRFFEVVRLSLIPRAMGTYQMAYRKLGDSNKAVFCTYAWLQKVKLEAQRFDTGKLNKEKLLNSLNEIRSYSTKDPSEFFPTLVKKLNDCGISLVVMPQIKSSYLQGAAFCSQGKHIIGITLRQKYADVFWFDLFHEIAHILLDHVGKEDLSSTDEKRADELAAELLIPESDFSNYLSGNLFDESSIVEFAQAQKIDPGIVVGRLQKYGKIPYHSHVHLRKQHVVN